MAVTATLSVQDASVAPGERVKFTVVFANDSTAVDVASSQIQIPLGAPGVPSANLTFVGSDPEVPEAGSKTAGFEVVFYTKATPDPPGPWEWDVQVNSYMSDGTYVASNAVTITVTD